MFSYLPFRLAVLVVALLVFSGTAAAQGTQGPSTTSPSYSVLTLSATAQTALQIDITAGAGGATVTGATQENSTGAFSLSFGNVNGLGIGTPSSGITMTTRDSGGALYTTPITLTPYFSGFTSTSATVKVYQDSSTSSNSQSALREGGAAGTVTTVPTSQASATTVTSSASSATNLTRYVGIYVSNANGASRVTGSLQPRVIYEISATP